MENYEIISIDALELTFEKGAVLSIEDLILRELFKEKSLTKRELCNIIKKVSFIDINKTLETMEIKGFVIRRNYKDTNYFYLTVAGAYEAEYRLNTNVFFELSNYLESFGYDIHNINGFLRNRFYQFYICDTWDGSTLCEQYLEWCESNNLNPKKPSRLKLTKRVDF